jgi:polyisoprenoid-binding protein YceI
MKKTTIFGSIAFAALAFAFKPAETATWTLDKNHAKLGFTVTHMMVSDVEGWFKTFDAKITANGADFTDAVVEMTADVNSINTDVEKRDTHLKSDDFFDVAKFPTLTFKSTSFKKADGGKYKVTGDLTMHGVTKSVVLDAVCRMAANPMSKKDIAGFKISGSLKRSDFGIGAKMGPTVLSDEITLVANAEFGKQ